MIKLKKLRKESLNQKNLFLKMPLFSKGTDKVFHIHIPKTGGRFIRNLFLENDFESSLDKFEESLYGIEIPHLHYPFYEKLLVSKCTHFSIVRNPLARFKSCLKSFLFISGEESLNINTMEEFETFVNYHLTSGTTYFLPQYKFLSKKTLVWKFEDGFKDEFFDWMESSVNLRIRNPRNITHSKQKFDDYKISVSEHLEELVKSYYKRDYELFNYSQDDSPLTL